MLLFGGIMVTSFLVGLFVWMEDPRAIPILRTYFLVLGGFALFNLAFLAGAGFERATISEILAYLRMLIFAGLWTLYFLKSARVRATFGRNL